MRQQTLEAAQQKTITSMTDALFPQLADAQKARREPQWLTCEVLNQAKGLKVKLILLKEQYPDNRGNLAEAVECMDNVCQYLQGHLRDIEKGIE